MKQMKRVLGVAILALLALAGCSPLQQDETSGLSQADPQVTEELAAPVETNQPDTLADGGNSAGASTESGASPAVFTIIPGESLARFELEEDLRSALTGWALGARITVVGETNQVSGDLVLDTNDLAAAQISEIRIDASTLKTNEFFRNRAIRNQILFTEAYPYITLTPTSITGLPASARVGDTVTFTINGDLTVRETTLAQTFVGTATLVSETQITGMASAVISREDYGLIIPNVANVTFVEDEVELYIDFVARSQ